MIRQATLLVTLCLLVACSVTVYEPVDGPPPHPVDVAAIADATPKPVVRTRAGNAESYTVLGKTYQVMADSRGYQARGKASWYGTKFHGRPTANGETYNMYAMTAAHKTLPIPSYVRVTNLDNGKTVVVRINDRGPFVGDRLIDLSYVAAKKLGMDEVGVATVAIVDVTPDSDQPDGATGLYLQLGAFQQRETAVSLKSRVLALLAAPVVINQGADHLHRVSLGPGDSEQTLHNWREVLQAHGLGSGFLVRRDNHSN